MYLRFVSSAMSCPGNQLYKECGSACPKVCSNMLSASAEASCASSCVDGCHCPEDMWRDGDSCVPQAHCSCYVNGVPYPHRSIKKTACQEWYVCPPFSIELSLIRS